MISKVYDLKYQQAPDLAYFSVSEMPLKQNPKAYTYGFEYTFCTWAELHLVTGKYSYSTMNFKDGHRLKEKVLGYGNIYIFDIDSKPEKLSYRAQEVQKAVKGIKSLIVSTRSHTSEFHRLRLILLADATANKNMDAELYQEVMLTIIDFCGLDAEMLDKSCFSIDRQYAPNPLNQVHYYIEGETLPMGFIIQMAIDRLKGKKTEVASAKVPIISAFNGGDLKEKRAFIKEHLSLELMSDVLCERGLTVNRDGKVTVPNNKTDALSIDIKTGLLRDFANDTSYDPVSVLHDYYHVPLADATNYIYKKMGGL